MNGLYCSTHATWAIALVFTLIGALLYSTVAALIQDRRTRPSVNERESVRDALDRITRNARDWTPRP